MKGLNRNQLKIIALITMLIDHIGIVFFSNMVAFRVIGRISFPIFAFVIAEGLHYTRDKFKYISRIFIFAILSQLPYTLLFQTYQLNILFTLFISIVLIIIAEKIKTSKIRGDKILFTILTSVLMLFLLIIEPLNLYDYGIYGILVVMAFYFFRNNNNIKFGAFVLLTLCYYFKNLYLNNWCFEFSVFVQNFSLLAILILLNYNNFKGKLNLKYVFYIFYPLHLIILLAINSFI